MSDKRPHIYFRADASKDIGYGHFVRTLALADMVGDGFERTFVTHSPSVYQIEQIKAICDDFIELGDDHFDAFLGIIEAGDIVVLDNYFFTTDYQRQIKAKGCKLVCIDDMHDKHYVADVVINHGLNDSTLFSVEPYTLLCLGLDWALVRKPFLDATPLPYNNREKGHCVVCFGGADWNNLTEKVCSVLSSSSRVNRITAIVGDAYGYCDSLGGIGKVEIRKNLSAQEMANLFCRVEFAVLPTSTVCIEALLCECPVFGGYYVDNQQEYYLEWSARNYIIALGDLKNYTPSTTNFEPTALSLIQIRNVSRRIQKMLMSL